MRSEFCTTANEIHALPYSCFGCCNSEYTRHHHIHAIESIFRRTLRKLREVRALWRSAAEGWQQPFFGACACVPANSADSLPNFCEAKRPYRHTTQSAILHKSLECSRCFSTRAMPPEVRIRNTCNLNEIRYTNTTKQVKLPKSFVEHI